jgi:tol-pal system protein YbgF
MPSETPPTPTPMQNETPAPTSEEAATGSLTDPNGAFQPSSTPSLGQITQGQTAPDSNGNITSGTPQGVTPPANAAQAYDKAFSYLQQSNYTDAQSAFLNFLTTYPTHPLAANAQYWLGETYFAQTQYSTAAKTFAKSFQDHPQGQKAPDSLLKLAMTLDKMNKREDACLTLGELSKRFPAGPASVLRAGNEERKRMGCKA